MSLDHEYLPQDGLNDFTRAAQVLLFGESSNVITSGCIHTIQGISGTGSLRLAGEFLAKFMKNRRVFIPSVSWENHFALLTSCGLDLGEYRYLDASGCLLDFEVMLQDISSAPEGSVVLFHMCAHNPTGVDPTEDQWREILKAVQDRKLLPFFDNAYQGFVTGCPDTDAFPVRLFAAAGLEMLVACSFAKNFGLYGERVGALHVVVSDPVTVPAITSQLRLISRTLYSTCPLYGARIVATIMNTPHLKAQWLEDCKAMADRLNSVRVKLHAALLERGVPGSWSHVIIQRGMFSFTGISAEVVRILKRDHHVYMLENGRISLAGLNSSNIERFVICVLQSMESLKAESS